MNTADTLREILAQRIMVLDGAMGTMIQRLGLTEEDFRGAEFADHPSSLKGCNDLLSLTRPQVIEDLHLAFLRAGADIIETNTFNAHLYPLADYGIEAHARRINRAAAEIAKRATATVTAETPERPRFVAGSIGPSTKTASLSPDVNDPGFRAVSFDDLVGAYHEQVLGLLEGGVDILLAETSFDTLNMKAALFAIDKAFSEGARWVPVMCSVTITDKSGRTLSGQTVEAFYASVQHASLFSLGINCALGADDMRPYVEEIARVSPMFTSCYPNAGLPNEFGGYDESPAAMAKVVGEFAQSGWVNMVGGCCGTTPEHIAAIAQVVEGLAPRIATPAEPVGLLSGLEPLRLTAESNFMIIGERTNVTGSAKFRRLISDGNYEEAVEVARQQVEGGANILDVCMDEGMLDGVAAMTRFLNLIAAEPDIARIPVMIDSSKFEIIEAGLKCIQGKGVVNSISLKEGEAAFRHHAELVRKYGAAVVVMAFDETGQATTTEHRVSICTRAYRILTEELGFPPEDIIFDPNILTVGTGIEEHANYAVSFIESIKQIKATLPHAKVSGGVSNLSFAFRSSHVVREAMHSAFLYHAIAAGLDMAIVNAGQLAVYEDIPVDLRDAVEDVIFNRREDATERLIEWATATAGGARTEVEAAAWRSEPLEARITHALMRGIADHIDEDIAQALEKYPSPLSIIEGPLMDGMNVVGALFGAGKMFLPQVVKSARVMKKAVAILEPLMEDANGQRQSKGKIVMATVKGDVHDIGKNIVGVVLRCNGFDVIDLGVMVPLNRILEAAKEHDAAFIGLSGLITPSLDEMIHVAKEMERRGLKIPLLIGGATTSPKHTAVRIAPAYSAPTVHVHDASLAVGVLTQLASRDLAAGFLAENAAKQDKLRAQFEATQAARTVLPLAEARARAPKFEWDQPSAPVPAFIGARTVEVDLATLSEWIDWTPFFHTWELSGSYPKIFDHPVKGERARELFDDAQAMLRDLVAAGTLRARGAYGFFPAVSEGEDIVVLDETRQREIARFPMMRQQGDLAVCRSLADFVAPKATGLVDHIGGFIVTAGIGLENIVAAYEADHDDYHAIMTKALADRLAEAFAEWLHHRVRIEWGYGDTESLSRADIVAEKYRGIRPAFGYPACPDHSPKATLFELLGHADHHQVTLTESYAMWPTAAVSGLYFAHPESRYFAVGELGEDQLVDYAGRRGITRTELARILGK